MENCKNPLTENDKIAKYDKLMAQRNNAVKKWNNANSDKLKTYKKKYYDANRSTIISNIVNNRNSVEKQEKYREYQKEYQKRYRERIKAQIAQNENDSVEKVD